MTPNCLKWARDGRNPIELPTNKTKTKESRELSFGGERSGEEVAVLISNTSEKPYLGNLACSPGPTK